MFSTVTKSNSGPVTLTDFVTALILQHYFPCPLKSFIFSLPLAILCAWTYFPGMTSIAPETIARVLELIDAGSSERAACAEVGINRGTFRSAVLRVGMADQYARATEALARDQVEKLETTIEEMRAGTIGVDVAKVEIDARKWIASKLFKPTWGDKQAVEHSGAVGVAQIDPESLTDEQLAAIASIKLAT